MKKRILLSVLTLALVMACAVFAVSAAGDTTQSIDLTTFKCPCSACAAARAENPKYVLPVNQWETTYNNTPVAGKHYYYKDRALKPGTQSGITSGEVVIVLDNTTLSFGGTTRALRVGAAATTKLHLIGNNGGLYFGGNSTQEGVIVQVDSKAEMHIYGDLTIGKAAEATGVTTSGGLIKVAAGSKFHIHDCDGMGLPTNEDPVLNAPALANTTSSLGGIATLTSTTASFIMDAGTLNGTSTCYRGSVFNVAGSTVTINGGTINAGTAADGGGAIMLSSGTVHFNAGTINGSATANGGTILVEDGKLTIGNDANYTAGATVNGGTATRTGNYGGLGGAIYQTGGEITMGTKGAISGGTAWRGGCVHVAAGGTFKMNGGSISGGKSTTQGAQVFLSGTFNMTAGTVTGNSKSTSNARCFRIQDGKLNLSGSAVVVAGGTAVGDALDVVSVSGIGEVTLDGGATVKNSSGTTDGHNIINLQNYNKKTAKLTVHKTWTGTARVNFEYLFGTDNKEADYAVGMTLDTEAAASTGTYTGNLYMYAAANEPPIYAGDNGTLQVAQVQLCTYDLPKLNAQWFKSGTEAAAAAQPGDYIGIYAAGTMDIGAKDVVVDFNGFDCTVTGTGKLYMLDAAGDGYDGTLAKVTYDNVASAAVNPYNDRQYVALPNGDGTYSAHRIDLRISAVSVRPRTAGMYYTAQLSCDDTLRAAFQNAGIAVSTAAVPSYDYETKSLYTVVETLDNGEFTGVLINEILKDGEDNTLRGKDTTVYANAYAKFTVDGQTVTVLADPYNNGRTKGDFLAGHRYSAYSLCDVMKAIDLRWRSLDADAQQRVLDQLYNSYDNVMHDWGLQYMVGQVKDLKVLTIGHSLAVDAGHMLGYIAKMEGMENIRFSTLYYGGCTLRQHATFLTNNTPEYRWYDTNITDLPNADAAHTVPEVSMKKVDQITMYEGIVADDWDIIVMQQGVFQAGMPEEHEEDLQTLIDYVRKHATNPNAVLMWNMIWAGPVESEMVDRSNNGTPPDAVGYEKSYEEITGITPMRDNVAAQDKLFELIRETVQTKIVPNSNFLAVMPAATAQQNALWSGLTDMDMYRDYIHASDLARYIYSYVWYCTLTDADFDGVASDIVPLAIRYIVADDISEIPAATEDLDLTQTVEGYDYSLLDVVNHAISSAQENPFTPKGIND